MVGAAPSCLRSVGGLGAHFGLGLPGEWQELGRLLPVRFNALEL